jgi:oligoendopeptidase F
MKKLPSWDLSDLYSSQKDPLIFKHLTAALASAKRFAKKYRRTLPTQPQKIASIFRELEKIELLAAKPIIYANLLFAESATPADRGAFVQRVKTCYSEVRKELTFFDLQLLALPDATLKKLLRSPELASFKHYMQILFESKKHRLPEDCEKIITDKDLTGNSAWVRYFDELFARKKFLYAEGKKTVELTETEILSKLYSPSASVRKAAHAGLSKGLIDDASRLTYATNVLLQDKAISDRLRNFDAPESSRHLANEISAKTVETMCRAVEKFYPTVQHFYRYKAKLLKTKRLHDYDRYAPVTTTQRLYSYAEAKTLVLDAFDAFSPAYGAIAREFFNKRWIDFAEREGKRGGAFCSFVTPDLHPYVFMNYHGTIREVFTLAHELGHAIHAYLMAGQNYFNFDTPLTIAETASVFAEMLLFEHIKQKTTDPRERRDLIIGKLESVFATVFRQVSMYRFEQDIHQHYRAHGELCTDTINSYWRARQEAMFKDALTLTPEYDFWWSYIPHFIHTPFYVYAYAFGELLTLALYAMYKDEQDAFIPKYLELLAAGGSKTPNELLKPMKINLEDPKFWKGGLRMIDDMVQELLG